MNQELIWEYFQNEDPASFKDSVPRLRYLASRIGSGKKVLNVGVGGGIFEKLALDFGLDVYSLDPSERAIETVREKLRLGEKAKVGYSQNMPFTENFFDAVIMSELLEHLAPEVAENSLLEAARVLKRGGMLIGTVPSRENLADSIVVCPDCGKRFHRWGHLQSFTPSSLQVLLSRYFQVGELSEKSFVSWKSLNWKGKASAALRSLLRLAGIHGSGESISFSGRKP